MLTRTGAQVFLVIGDLSGNLLNGDTFPCAHIEDLAKALQLPLQRQQRLLYHIL